MRLAPALLTALALAAPAWGQDMPASTAAASADGRRVARVLEGFMGNFWSIFEFSGRPGEAGLIRVYADRAYVQPVYEARIPPAAADPLWSGLTDALEAERAAMTEGLKGLWVDSGCRPDYGVRVGSVIGEVPEGEQAPICMMPAFPAMGACMSSGGAGVFLAENGAVLPPPPSDWCGNRRYAEAALSLVKVVVAMQFPGCPTAPELMSTESLPEACRKYAPGAGG